MPLLPLDVGPILRAKYSLVSTYPDKIEYFAPENGCCTISGIDLRNSPPPPGEISPPIQMPFFISLC